MRATPDSITLRVNVDSTASVGKRDLFAAGAPLRDAAVVYDKIDRIKVIPNAGLARAGGVVFPKQLQQFDAIAYYNGPDGKSDTDDDLEIGRVNATWSLEEYGVTYDDDDVKFVGAIAPNGLFTPNADGPNPARSSSRNNVGDVWVVASYQAPGKTPQDAQGARAADRHRAAVRQVSTLAVATMNLIRRGEYHAFAGGDAHFLYLVPSAAVVRIDDVTQAVLDCLETGDRSPGDLTTSLGDRWTPEDVRVVDRRAARTSRGASRSWRRRPSRSSRSRSAAFRCRRSCSTSRASATCRAATATSTARTASSRRRRSRAS